MPGEARGEPLSSLWNPRKQRQDLDMDVCAQQNKWPNVSGRVAILPPFHFRWEKMKSFASMHLDCESMHKPNLCTRRQPAKSLDPAPAYLCVSQQN